MKKKFHFENPFISLPSIIFVLIIGGNTNVHTVSHSCAYMHSAAQSYAKVERCWHFLGYGFKERKFLSQMNEFLMVEFQASIIGWTYTPRYHAYIQPMMAWSMSKWDSVSMSIQGHPLDYSFQSIHVIQGDRASSNPAQNNLSFNNLTFIDPISTTFFFFSTTFFNLRSPLSSR